MIAESGEESGNRIEQGYPESEIETGERYLESPMTGRTYRVTKWVDKGDGKFIALEKELVDDD